MNAELGEIIKIYATKSSKELQLYLTSKSKPNLIGVLIDLITIYINDKNSSTLREYLTVTIAGYKHSEGKIGYNGYKQNSYERPIKCEAKPQNIRSGTNRKLNGRGNFTDYTYERFKKDLAENLNMLVSGFIDGKLIYIIEFPFSCRTFKEKLEKHLKKRFPSGDISGQFLRSANFYYKDFINCEKLNMIFCLPKKELIKYKNFIVKDFYKFLENIAQ